MNELDMDVRLLRRNLAKGFVSQQSVDEILAKLPDVADRAEWIDPTLEEDDDESGEAAAE